MNEKCIRTDALTKEHMTWIQTNRNSAQRKRNARAFWSLSERECLFTSKAYEYGFPLDSLSDSMPSLNAEKSNFVFQFISLLASAYAVNIKYLRFWNFLICQ